MEAFIASLAAKYPWALIVVSVIGTFRVLFKPTMTYIETVVASTETKVDDNFLASLKESKIYKGISWVVDYLLSIKLPQK